MGSGWCREAQTCQKLPGPKQAVWHVLCWTYTKQIDLGGWGVPWGLTHTIYIHRSQNPVGHLSKQEPTT